jgi:hypothetical protein
MEECIHFNMPAAQYHAAPGLSHSGMNELSVSPKNYWSKRLDPKRKPPDSKHAQQWGTALHCRLLEPEFWLARYARKGVDRDDFDGRLILDKQQEMKDWLKDHRQPVGGTNEELMRRIEALIGTWPEIERPILWGRVKQEQKLRDAGKVTLSGEDHDGVEAAASAAMAEPAFRAHLVGGYPEVSIFVRDDEPEGGKEGGRPGAMLKCRLDYLTVPQTVDLKSFRIGRKEPLKEAVNREIERYKYYRQGVWYHDLRERARKKLLRGELKVYGDVDPNFLLAFKHQAAHRFLFLFVENQPPYHLDARRLLAAVERGPTPEKYWLASRSHQRDMITLYDYWMQECGTARPWGDPLAVSDLSEFDLPRLAYEVGEEEELDYLATADGGLAELQASEL